jgi:CheY-like chemotaxis protein
MGVEEDGADHKSILDFNDKEDIEIVTAGTGAEALRVLRREPCDCVVLDLRLPDMTGFEVLEELSGDAKLSDVPVVVFTGRELSAEEDAELHTMARSIVVKGVESPERLLDETALFLHRVVTELPPEKQRMLERLNSSDDDLVGRTVLLVDDDARNIFALSSVLERRGMHVHKATTGSEGLAWPDATPATAEHRAHGKSHEGRPREVHGSRRVRLSGQACEYRAALIGAAHVVASLSRGDAQWTRTTRSTSCWSTINRPSC